jgi:4'-phosphopantetheinyl transferase
MGDWREEIWTCLREGGVACVCQRVDDAGPVDKAFETLSPEERERAGRFRSETDRACFQAGRVLLRRLLIPGVDPAGLEITIGSRGKPLCADPRAPAFNLSHAAGWVALALAPAGKVGVDLESADRRVRVDRLAGRVFSQTELEAVGRGGRRGFLRMWTRKEARVKAEGTGIGTTLKSIDTLEPGGGGWVYHAFTPGEGMLGCVAVPEPRPPFRVWRWFPADERLQSL